MHATVSHAVERYGLAEVQRWSFEVWNELWGFEFPGDYMDLYNASAHAVKGVHSSLLVGGPATAVLEHVSDFTQECKQRGIPYDFVSSHHYPTDGGSQFTSKCPSGENWDPDCFNTQVAASRASVASDRFYLTEYNVGCCLGYPLHDTPAAAAFIFRAVGGLNDLMDVYSYWTFTDVFEEGGLPLLEFKDIYGMMTVRGLPKPAWRAFQLLHDHAGDKRLPVFLSNQTAPSLATLPGGTPLKAQVSAFATIHSTTVRDDESGGAGICVFLSNWGNPDTAPANATGTRNVRVTVLHAATAAPASAAVLMISPATTHPRALWDSMGSPGVPNATQRAALMTASQVGPAAATSVVRLNESASAVVVALPENSAAVVVFS